jgi:nicotinamide-nucleotide amidase
MEIMLTQVEAVLKAKKLVEAPLPMARASLIGASEPEVARLIAPVLEAYPEVTANILAKPEQISLTLMDLRGGAADGGESAVQSAFKDMLVRLGKLVSSASGESLPEVVGSLMRDTGLTLATAESVTAGQIGVLVASVPGASDYFLGGVTAYANEAKESLIGVQMETIEQSGAVSAETATAMAEGARHALGADIGLAVTGVAGPGGASPEKPAGLVYTGLALPNRTVTFKDVHRGDRGSVQQRAAFRALDHLRRSLIGEGADGRG